MHRRAVMLGIFKLTARALISQGEHGKVIIFLVSRKSALEAHSSDVMNEFESIIKASNLY